LALPLAVFSSLDTQVGPCLARRSRESGSWRILFQDVGVVKQSEWPKTDSVSAFDSFEVIPAKSVPL